MNRRPSYASVAAGAPSRASLLTHVLSGGNSNALTSSYSEHHEAEHSSIPSTHAHITPTQDQEHASNISEDQFALHWDNEFLKYSNIDMYGRHTVIPPPHTGGRDRFVMPSYLQGSRYMQKLVDRQEKNEFARREVAEATSHRSSRRPSSSNLSGHKMVPSHRGMTYEVIEARPPDEEHRVPPLPSQWADGKLEISADGCGLRWPTSNREQVYGAVQADHHMPPDVGIYYFEVTIEQLPRQGLVAVGFSGPETDLQKLPGWDQQSWGWHGDDGKKFNCATNGHAYERPFGKGDTVGCGVNFWTGTAFFTKNGWRLEDAFRELSKILLFPSVGMKGSGAHVRVNFGQEAFKFNIDGEVKKNKARVRSEMDRVKLSSVLSGRTEDDFIKELVAQFLRQGGFVETAKSFATEVQAEHRALGTTSSLSENAAEEDIDAAQRQQVRSAILTGDIDKAIRCTNDFYPQVLSDNPIIAFRLKCRRFLEMIRRTTENPELPEHVSPVKMEKARASLPSSIVATNTTSEAVSGAMDLDEPSDAPPVLPETMITSSIYWPAETSDGLRDLGSGTTSQIGTVDLQAAIAEGSTLQADYGQDVRREVREMMRHVMGIWAYTDPTKSKEVGYLFQQGERAKVAEDLNAAILASMGKPSVAAIEKMAQQVEVLTEELTEFGLPGAFINVERDILL